MCLICINSIHLYMYVTRCVMFPSTKSIPANFEKSKISQFSWRLKSCLTVLSNRRENEIWTFLVAFSCDRSVLHIIRDTCISNNYIIIDIKEVRCIFEHQVGVLHVRCGGKNLNIDKEIKHAFCMRKKLFVKLYVLIFPRTKIFTNLTRWLCYK